jgi:hypothetical protein
VEEEAQAKKKKSKRGKKGEKEEEETCIEEANWVQCEKACCMKWRLVPPHVHLSMLPELFECKHNFWDPKTASCDAEEVYYDHDDITTEQAGQYNLAETELKDGTWVDCYCHQNKMWYEGWVVKVDATRVKIHFNKWATTFDEWVEKKDPRLAPHHSHTKVSKDWLRRHKDTDGGKKKEAKKGPKGVAFVSIEEEEARVAKAKASEVESADGSRRRRVAAAANEQSAKKQKRARAVGPDGQPITKTKKAAPAREVLPAKGLPLALGTMVESKFKKSSRYFKGVVSEVRELPTKVRTVYACYCYTHTTTFIIHAQFLPTTERRVRVLRPLRRWRHGSEGQTSRNPWSQPRADASTGGAGATNGCGCERVDIATCKASRQQRWW